MKKSYKFDQEIGESGVEIFELGFLLREAWPLFFEFSLIMK